MSDQQLSFPRPLPHVEGVAAPYWRALAAGRIELPCCTACDKFIFPPRSFCPHCQSSDVRWQTVNGRGTVYTFTIVHKPTNPYFFDKVPYVYALVELECGVRVPSRLVDGQPEQVTVGDAVEAVFEGVDDNVTLLHFRPRG